MADIIQDNGGDKTPITIEPISFRSKPSSKRPKPFIIFKWGFGVLIGIVLIFLCISAWFVFTARQVVIDIEPVPERIVLSGSILTPRIGNYYLIRPGEYKLSALKECFLPLDHTFWVGDEKRQNLHLKMQKRPGRLMIRTYDSGDTESNILGAQVYVDGTVVGNTPIENLEILPGLHKIEILAENYQNFQTDVNVHGCGKFQEFNMAMLPGWSDITISSVPIDANVLIDGKSFGKTPLNIQLSSGSYLLEINADRFKTWKHRLNVKPNDPQEIRDVRLQPADGKLTINTKPDGANIIIDGTFVGQTPLTFDLSPDKHHVVQISKAGYEKTNRKVQVVTAASKQLNVNLKPRRGIVHLSVEPPDTELIIDGKSWGVVPKKLNLIAVEHKLEFNKKGFHPYRISITPQPGFPKQLKVALKKKGVSKETEPLVITTKTGYRLKLIQSGSYTMGSSRREQGHRSNETFRKVKLARPFYMGLKEVSNQAFKEFIAQHNSGLFKSQSLNNAAQPAVQVTWEQAARFCNWLSAKESLPPAYVQKGNTLIAAEPLNTGYRLPTEAEWEYCARFIGKHAFSKYPWGNTFPPVQLSGNYSDQSAKNLLPTVLEGYNDEYVTTAPPAKFKPNTLGLYDMGGNVAEWCHDFYSIYSYDPEKTYVDPTGPKDGKHHVIRGSSWKHGSINTLRLAYRSYGDDKREDVGFRVCRYLK
ncbi:MAG: SUMF1/EgtB/PvdO family nonheme iron enzyme [Desulfobacteraceae bacterium]|nr:SUMF1/EgtB/PvdO family nonheme iron enzyme [Desulfobacteraceae bacterium]